MASQLACDVHVSVSVFSVSEKTSHWQYWIDTAVDWSSARPMASLARVSSHHVRSARVVGSFSTTPTERSVGCICSICERAGSRPGEL